jgi:hypothetical protein
MLSELEGGGDAKTLYRGHSASALRKALPQYLERNEREHESFIVRPRGGHLLQVDDCTLEVVKLLRPHCRFTIRTSHDSYQAWLAFKTGEELAAVRERLFEKLKPAGANPGGNGALRFPGSLNCKLKHRRSDDTFPRVFLDSTFGRMATFANLEAAHLLAPLSESRDDAPRRATTRDKHAPTRWPDYARCLREHPHKERPGADVSDADASFAFLAVSMGWPESDIEAKLLELSDHAKRKGSRGRAKYVRGTVVKAVRFHSTRSH